MSFQCFAVAMQYFDEVLLDLKKNRKEFIKQLNVAGVGVNVCGAVEAPKGRPKGEWHPIVPWPRYCRKVTFCNSEPHPFSY